VEGRIAVESWSGRDGKPQSTLTITANTVRFLGRATADDNAGQAEAKTADEEIPI
jgi:single-stranded DNA-binding protein